MKMQTVQILLGLIIALAITDMRATDSIALVIISQLEIIVVIISKYQPTNLTFSKMPNI